MLRGLLALVPLGITAYVLMICYNLTAGYLVPFVQSSAVPLPGYAVVFLSIVLFLGLLFIIGVVTTAVAGRKLIALFEGVLRRIPLVKTIYGASKQVVEVLSLQDAAADYQASVFVDFPFPGTKALAFLTGRTLIEGDREYYRVFVPTTPNFTSGYFELYPPERIYGNNLSVEDAIKGIISAGILLPQSVAIDSFIDRRRAAPEPEAGPDELSASSAEPMRSAEFGTRHLESRKQSSTAFKRAKVLIRKRLVSGFLMIVPLGITFFVIRFIYDLTVGKITPFTERFLGHLPGIAVTLLSVALFLAALYVLGIVTTAVVGKRLMDLAEWGIDRIPLVKTIYGASKQMVETLAFHESGPTLKATALVEFPYPGIKALGFVVGNIHAEDGQAYYKVFVPTTPNITVGLLQMYKPEDLRVCDLSVEDAIKSIVSGGILAPSYLRVTPPAEDSLP
jgi:uncharacterized membrane protein